MTNKEIAQQFSFLAKLLDIHQLDDRMAKNYSNLAFTIDRYPTPITSVEKEKLSSIRGIGKVNAPMVVEVLDTHSLAFAQELIEKTPSGILELMTIKGIGPKKISTIWHELELESPGELLYACYENRLVNYKGFGAKTQQNILEAVEYYLANQGSLLYAQALPISNQIEHLLISLFGIEHVYVTGEFARQCEIINEIEFVVLGSNEDVFEALAGNEFLTLIEEDEESFTYRFHEVINCIIHVCNDKEELSSKLFFTLGSNEFIEQFEVQFPTLDYQQEYSRLDESIFKAANIQYILPCLRDSSTSINRSIQNELPELIQPNQIKGIIHTHSTWSDGKNTIEEMANACIQKGYEYLVVSDHSVSSFYANGLSIERIYQQHEEINRLNEKVFPFRIFKSIECDILGDGRLDYADEILGTFDLVLTSIHQNLVMTEEKAMSRLMGAIENPYTRILCHPTGRLLLSRKGYPIDFEKILEACLKHNVILELNANPRRLDMDWRFIETAIEAGLMLSINPDAHSIEGINDVKFGVLCAQKGFMEMKHNLSSLSLEEFELFLKRK